MMKVLVTGGNGQFAKSMRASSGFQDLEIDYVSRTDLDITNVGNWERVLTECLPEVVINAAAYTDVEAAEDHAEAAFAVNNDGAALGALACMRANIKFIHLSTDYVFNGHESEPLDELTLADPLNTYGDSKWAGEKAVLDVNPKALVIRISWLYSPFGKNFYTMMLNLFRTMENVNVVNDQIASPTNAIVFAENLLSILPQMTKDSSLHGIVHYAEEGQASWYDFAQEIHKLCAAKCTLSAVDSSFFKTKAERPKYSKLNNEKFKSATGINPIAWQAALEKCYRMTDKRTLN